MINYVSIKGFRRLTKLNNSYKTNLVKKYFFGREAFRQLFNNDRRFQMIICKDNKKYVQIFFYMKIIRKPALQLWKHF